MQEKQFEEVTELVEEEDDLEVMAVRESFEKSWRRRHRHEDEESVIVELEEDDSRAPMVSLLSSDDETAL